MQNTLFTIVSSAQSSNDLGLFHLSITFSTERFIKGIIDYSSNARRQFLCLIIGVKASFNHRTFLTSGLSRALVFADTSKDTLRQIVQTQNQIHNLCNFGSACMLPIRPNILCQLVVQPLIMFTHLLKRKGLNEIRNI